VPPPRRCTHRAAPWTPLIALLACLVAAPGVGGDGASTNSGYNLYAPLGSTIVSLADMGGDVAHSWDAGYPPGHAVYLLENGDLLHTGDVGEGAMNGGGKGGIVQRLAPDGRVLWQYRLSDDRLRLPHGVEPLPNGNVLMIA